MMTLKALQKNLGYLFQDTALLLSALTHRSKNQRSASNQEKSTLPHHLKNNERLEFLGDSVLSLIITSEIFYRYPTVREGELSRLRAALVKGETIAKIAFELGIGDSLQLGVGELKSGGYRRESILAGAFEAVIGAIFCDSDFLTVKQCVLQWYGDLIDHIDDLTDVKDAKTMLQEWMQARQKPLPTYEFMVTGDAHAQQFTVTCHVDGFSFETQGQSTNRRKAEQIAAKVFLKKLSV